MMDGSVLDVVYLTSPQDKGARTRAYALFAAGAVLLAMAALAFGVGMDAARDDQASRREWLREGKVAAEWRPRPLHPAYDWMALGGSAAGILCLAAGLARLREPRRYGSTLRICPDPQEASATSGAPAFPLVAPRGAGFVLHFTTDMEGALHVPGRSGPLAELRAMGAVRPSSRVAGAYELDIPDQARGLVRVGKRRFAIASVAVPLTYAVPLPSLSGRFTKVFVAGSASLLLSVAVLLQVVPPKPRALALDPGRTMFAVRAHTSAGSIHGHFARSADEWPSERHLHERRPARQNECPASARQLLPEPLLYEWRQGRKREVWEDWKCWQNCGGICGPTSPLPLSIDIGAPKVVREIDKNIARYLWQRMGRIRGCYDRSSNRDLGFFSTPLAGTVVTRFQVSPQGTVLDIKADGVSSEVARCVADAVQAIQFPRTGRSAPVQIRFSFKASSPCAECRERRRNYSRAKSLKDVPR